MMCLSQTTGYAIQALGCLNDSACECRQIAELARCSGVPKAYLAKIFNVLARRGILTAKRGYRGGITLARKPTTISLLEIVEAIEGTGWLGDCLLNLATCATRSSCPTHEFWQRIRRDITEELRRTTLADVMAFNEGRTETRRERNAVRKT